MKVLHITASNKGGAGIAALRLHKALVNSGVQSAYLSRNVTIDFQDKIIEDSFFKYKKVNIVQRIQKKLDVLLNFSKLNKAQSKLNVVKDKLDYEIYSLPFSNSKLHEHPLVQEADILNFHWMGGILDFESFFKNCKKPIVWTLHDLNPIQGIFHYKNDVIYNQKYIGIEEEKLSKYKFEVLNNSTLKAFVSPSNWLLNEVNKKKFNSNILKQTIPNCIDFENFHIQEKTAIRTKYGISSEDFVVLFVADSLKNKRKGFDLMLEALEYLQNISLTIVTIGKGTIDLNSQKVVALGEIHDVEKMAEIYALADVFVLPSREDNLPNVMLEAFACGTPVISFNHGGMKDYIINNETGILVEDISGKKLAEGIQQFYSTRKSYDSQFIAKFAKDYFSKEQQALAYTKLYKQILN
ncbi:MAG: glycosyltransferase [Flavobacterium sp.]|nr:glycosyltransferase [Flavobacterium sp.]